MPLEEANPPGPHPHFMDKRARGGKSGPFMCHETGLRAHDLQVPLIPYFPFFSGLLYLFLRTFFSPAFYLQ